MADALCIAIVGAESTGKTTLAHELRETLAARTGLRVAGVDEWLRRWCDEQGRTPAPGEQRGIAAEQQRRIEAAAAGHDIVVCDTTPLMTAVYSRWCFGDTSLDADAVRWHRRMDATLLMALDLPWVADGLQRDGAHVRSPVDALLRTLLQAHGLSFGVIAGAGPQRLHLALAALQPLLRRRGVSADLLGPATRAGGTFSRLLGDAALRGGRAGWRCECCEPGAERGLQFSEREPGG